MKNKSIHYLLNDLQPIFAKPYVCFSGTETPPERVIRTMMLNSQKSTVIKVINPKKHHAHRWLLFINLSKCLNHHNNHIAAKVLIGHLIGCPHHVRFFEPEKLFKINTNSNLEYRIHSTKGQDLGRTNNSRDLMNWWSLGLDDFADSIFEGLSA